MCLFPFIPFPLPPSLHCRCRRCQHLYEEMLPLSSHTCRVGVSEAEEEKGKELGGRGRRMTWVFSSVGLSVGRRGNEEKEPPHWEEERGSSSLAALVVTPLDVSLRKWFFKRERGGWRRRLKKGTGDADAASRRVFALCIHADVPMRHSPLCETRSSLFTPPLLPRHSARAPRKRSSFRARSVNPLSCSGGFNWRAFLSN